mgnify:CR=1 FL=1
MKTEGTQSSNASQYVKRQVKPVDPVPHYEKLLQVIHHVCCEIYLVC